MTDNFRDSKLRSFILSAYRQQATGCLSAEVDHQSWQVWLHRGRLVWCTGDRHRVRRWKRAVTAGVDRAVRSPWDGMAAANELATRDSRWEIQCLAQAVAQGQLSIEAAQGMALRVAIEVFFLVDQPDTKYQWLPQPIELPNTNLSLPSSMMGDALTRSRNLQRHWERLGVNPLWIDRGWLYRRPIEATTDTSTTLTLAPLLNGERTFWDISAHLDPGGTNVGGVIKILQLLWQRNQLATLELPDVVLTGKSKPPKLLLKVACVDDDLKICQTIEKIVTKQGHQFIGCFEPLSALPKVIEAQPDVVFLDVVMPVINGHELCAQLRRVQQLSHTSIVMLTSADGLFDRARAKLSGATSFLSKPVTTDKVLGELVRHQHNQVVMVRD